MSRFRSRFEPEHLLIVGAGASFNAGLPLASNFTRELTDLRGLKRDGPSGAQVGFIKEFISETFSGGGDVSVQDWPELEDIFTLIDLSANSGHNLGGNYSAGKLRTVRRALLVRMIRMFAQKSRRKMKSPDANWSNLEHLLKGFDCSSTAVLSMNWDTVFEQGLQRTQEIDLVDYGCDAIAADFVKDKIEKSARGGVPFHIVKPHGSVNWLYCDNCRSTFWLDGAKYEKVAQVVLRDTDWETILPNGVAVSAKCISPQCPECTAKSLSTRFATFSYKKALDFPMLTSSWETAEKRLAETANWVFFGYSMPAADFEFKAMLKRVQLTEQIKPKITVITGGDDAHHTIGRFKKFFGNDVEDSRCFSDGLDEAALEYLEDIGIVRG